MDRLQRTWQFVTKRVACPCQWTGLFSPTPGPHATMPAVTPPMPGVFTPHLFLCPRPCFLAVLYNWGGGGGRHPPMNCRGLPAMPPFPSFPEFLANWALPPRSRDESKSPSIVDQLHISEITYQPTMLFDSVWSRRVPVRDGVRNLPPSV